MQNAPPLPADFLFGLGNSDSQCEAFEPGTADIRDLWYERRRLQPRLRATDFWNRYPEDIALARDLGCRAFRFSLAWARIEPEPDRFSEAALDHYARVADSVRAAGMEPFVTLCHFVWPLHVERRGGMLDDRFPAMFARYAAQAGSRLGHAVQHWATFNEPNILAFGYIKPWWESVYPAPPGLPPKAGALDQVRALHLLMRNLLLAHTAARQALKQLRPDARVGANPASLGLPIWLQRWMDRNVLNLRHAGQAGAGERGFAERTLLERGRVDLVLAALTRTPQRQAALDFAEAYLITGQRLLTRAGHPATGLDGLARGTVAVIAGSTAEADVARLLPLAGVRAVSRYDDAVALLDAESVAAILADEIRHLALLRAEPGRYRLVGPLLTSEAYAPAIAKGQPELLAAVDGAIRDMIESGGWAASWQAHLGEPVPPPPPGQPRLATLADLTPRNAVETGRRARGLARIRARGRLVVGVGEAVPGLSELAADGVRAGLEIDLARAVAARILGAPEAVELVPMLTAARVPALRGPASWLDKLQRIWGILATTCTTSWWHLAMAGKLPEFICPAECVGQLDFVAFDYYWGVGTLRLGRLLDLADALIGGRFERAPVHARGLCFWVMELARRFPGLPIYVMENGCVDQADGIDRAEYLRRHVAELQRAVAAGAPVRGYLGWSITSNRELGHPFSSSTDFGLYHIDLDTDPALLRHPTPAAEAYRAIIRARGVPA
jgi:beta-glucosidase/6-phospho-beta-glucosidase/beta-galactosidase/ABC-type amino acid transport substrate-binding protein